MIFNLSCGCVGGGGGGGGALTSGQAKIGLTRFYINCPQTLILKFKKAILHGEHVSVV